MLNDIDKPDAIKYKEIEDKLHNDIFFGFPDYVFMYFDKLLAANKSIKTIEMYAWDIRCYYKYLMTIEPGFVSFKDITIEELNRFGSRAITNYLKYLRSYEDNGKIVSNKPQTIRRKLSVLRSYMNYYYMQIDDNQMAHLDINWAKQVDPPKVTRKKKNRLDSDEVNALFHSVQTGDGLPKSKEAWSNRSRLRDTAIIMLFSYTGIRVSELARLDLTDFDKNKRAIKVLRKGGNEDIVYLKPEVFAAIVDYIDNERFTYDDGNQALFLSTRHGTNNRLTTRSIENIVSKFGAIAAPLKNVTPHTMRRTFGTALYNKTGDIDLVANVLGHSSVNTTAQYYVEPSEKHKEIVRSFNY